MRAPLILATSLWAFGAALPAQAQLVPAQPNLTTVTLSIGGVENTTMGEQFINAKACADDASTVVVRVRMLGSVTQSNISVWVGNNCHQDRAPAGDNPSDCVHIDQEPLNNMPELTIPIPVGMLRGCDGDMKVQTWFLAMDNPTSTTEAITYYGLQEYSVDTIAPPAPTNVSGGSGESQISVDWDSAGGDIQNFYIYWDTEIGGGGDNDAGSGECATSNVHEGAQIDPDAAPTGVGKKKTSSNATSTNLDGADIDGDMAGVAVQSVDQAGNVSALSETACVDVVPTSGFWELYEAEGGEAKEGCACSVPGGARTSRLPKLGVGGLFALALVALRRRRRA